MLLDTITKKDLAHQVAKATGCKKNFAYEAIDRLFEVMREQLIEGSRIEIRGFGVLSVKNTKPNPTAHNPRTGERIFVPARRKAHFKPGLLLKKALHPVPGSFRRERRDGAR